MAFIMCAGLKVHSRKSNFLECPFQNTKNVKPPSHNLQWIIRISVKVKVAQVDAMIFWVVEKQIALCITLQLSMSGIAFMGVRCDQKGAEDTALRGSSVCGLCVIKPVPQVFKAATWGRLYWMLNWNPQTAFWQGLWRLRGRHWRWHPLWFGWL